MTLVTADITKPETYPPLLKTKIEDGFDIFYMKAAVYAPRDYPRFLPHIARYIRQDGWLMTTDKTVIMEIVNPEPFLKQNGLSFTLQNNDEIQTLIDHMPPPYHPLTELTHLVMYPGEKRKYRVPAQDSTYWNVVTLRQKLN